MRRVCSPCWDSSGSNVLMVNGVEQVGGTAANSMDVVTDTAKVHDLQTQTIMLY